MENTSRNNVGQQQYVQENKERQKEKVQEILGKLIQEVTSDHLVDDIAKVIIKADRPSDSWSLRNRILMLVQGSTDARSFNAWKAVGRHVIKGKKAIYVVRPIVAMVDKVVMKEGKEVTEKFPILVGFAPQPEFRYEDTEGKELPHQVGHELPPLANVAQEWGLRISFDDLSMIGALGSWNEKDNVIKVGVKDDISKAMIYFHELSHAAYAKVDPERSKLYHTNPADHIREETIVQLSACVIGKLYGIKSEGFTQSYIKKQIASNDLKKVTSIISSVLSNVDQVVNMILFGEKRNVSEVSA